MGVSLQHLNKVIDYPANDMTITVQAGMTIAELQRTLASEGQRLPVDVPLAERATLGGAMACNASGPCRYGYGTLRDYVIGIGLVNEEGKETKAGGRVVKNVAGYDLCKLYVGSWGTLGIITQATLKVRPLPEASAIVRATCRTAELGSLLDRLHATRTRPIAISVLNDSAAGAAPGRLLANKGLEWLVLVCFEETQVNVAWQLEQIASEFRVGMERVDGNVTDIMSMLTDFPLMRRSPLSFRANVLPSQLAEFLAVAGKYQVMLLAHADGVVDGMAHPEITADQAREWIGALRRHAIGAQGNLILTSCPEAWQAELDVWGEPRGDLWLMKSVKQRLDPKNVFNPGRFVGGI